MRLRGDRYAGTLMLWTVVVFLLMLCTFGIGAASGKLCADSASHLEATSAQIYPPPESARPKQGHCT